jgi:hypothetical protein
LFVPCFLTALRDELVGKADARGHVREAVAKAGQDRVTPFEHQAIVFCARDEHVACLDPELPPERSRHDKSALSPDRDFGRSILCHFNGIVPHK